MSRFIYDAKRAEENFRRRYLTGFPGKVTAAAHGDTDALVEHLRRHRLSLPEQKELAWLIVRSAKRNPRGRPAGGLTWRSKLDRAKQYVKTFVSFGNRDTYVRKAKRRIRPSANAQLYLAAIKLVEKLLPGHLGEYDLLVQGDKWPVSEDMRQYLLEWHPEEVRQMRALGELLAEGAGKKARRR
jgi:hypothetical protein